MYFLWTVTLKENISSGWVNQIGEIFDIDQLKDSEFLDLNIRSEINENWFNTVYQALGDIRSSNSGLNKTLFYIGKHEVFIEDIFPRFSHYEKKRFLIVLIKVDFYDDGKTSYEVLWDALKEKLEEQFAKHLEQQFELTTKSKDINETLSVCNPILLATEEEKGTLQEENPDWKELSGNDYTKLYQIKYDYTKPARTRKLIIVYLLKSKAMDKYFDKGDRLGSLINIVQSEYLIFLRGKAMEQELSPIIKKNGYLKKAVNLLEEMWPKVRLVFFLMPRFNLINKVIVSKLFFNLLEANAQVNTLLECNIYKMKVIDNYYEERFERILFNVERQGSKAEMDYFNNVVYENAKKYYQNAMSDLLIIKSMCKMIEEQVNTLRNDFDSNTNFMLQWLMFILSIILLGWGALSLIYDNLVHSSVVISDYPPFILLTMFVAALAIYLLCSNIFSRLMNLTIKKDLRNLIDKWTNDENTSMEKTETINSIAVPYYERIDNTENARLKLFNILELFTIITLGISVNKVDNRDAETILDQLATRIRTNH